MREQLVQRLSRGYGTHAYAKWSGAFWRLISLVDLGVEPGHPGAVAAAEETLEWVASPSRLAEIRRRRIDGRIRRCGSMEGRALQACLDVGLRGDPRLDVLAEELVESQWPDGGWNCDRKPHVTHSSFNETWGPILGLASYGAMEAVARGAEFLLEHRVVFSHRTGEPAHPRMLKVHYPPYWHYDVLAGLRTLQAAGALVDSRTADALDLLEAMRRPDGTWRSQGQWWKRPGSAGSNVEVVEWGHAADEVLTEQAMGVLASAGRL
ncbi:MAG TPA: hypothetical protein VJ807_02600 [Gaiellaceae bacterium]|nr:hypothetical protein [Gaiellaceae bacterium]